MSAGSELALDRAWTHRRFFELLEGLGGLRVIHQSGASTFEALCRFGPFEIQRGFMNAITGAYHWHLALDRFGFVRSVDGHHARSNRRVLFFELCPAQGEPPFCRIYLHRERGAEFEGWVLAGFLEAHAGLGAGCVLAREDAR